MTKRAGVNDNFRATGISRRVRSCTVGAEETQAVRGSYFQCSGKKKAHTCVGDQCALRGFRNPALKVNALSFLLTTGTPQCNEDGPNADK